MRVLVTGGAGFIGGHLVRALAARGHEVEALDDLSQGHAENLPADVRLHRVDVRDAAAVRAALLGFRPEVVCHLAAQISVSRSLREPLLDASVNVLGSLHVLEASCAAGVARLVFASTGGAIYGEVPEGERAREDWPALPTSVYGISKLTVERYLSALTSSQGPALRVLRYANVYGPGQDPLGEAGVVAIFTERALAGHPLVVHGRRRAGDTGCVRDYVYVMDVVQATLAAAEGDLAEPLLNVGTGVETTTQRLAEQLRALTGDAVVIEAGPPRPGDLERSVLDPTRLTAALGRPPVELRSGLEQTLAWYRARRAAC